MKGQFMDVKIPLELLDYLDQGKNPQLYTRECLERTVNRNKEVCAYISRFYTMYYVLGERKDWAVQEVARKSVERVERRDA